MNMTNGQKTLWLSLILGIFAVGAPIYAMANPRAITPDSLDKGYKAQQAAISGQIKGLQDTYSKTCENQTVYVAGRSSKCIDLHTQVVHLNDDLHTLQISYQLMQASLQ